MQSIDMLRRLAVFDRERIERVLRDLLESRIEDDFDRCAPYFTPGVVWDVVGDRRLFPYAGRYEGGEAVIAILRRMQVDIQYIGHELLDLLIDQDRAMVRRRVLVKHRGTGVTLWHEIWDLFRFEDGMIAHVTQFIDGLSNLKLQGIAV